MTSAVVEDQIRVFLVDDHRAVLWGLERLILSAEDKMQLLGSATSLAELRSAPESLTADVIVLDLDLNGEDCSNAFAELLKEYSGRVLVLTGTRDGETHRRAVLAGAHGLVRKDEPVDVLLKAIEKVHAGEFWLSRSLVSQVMGSLTGAPSEVREERTRIASLTHKEREVVAAVVRHRGAKSVVVADELGISEHTLRNHLSAIYHKLGVHRRLELYLYAREHGLAPAS